MRSTAAAQKSTVVGKELMCPGRSYTYERASKMPLVVPLLSRPVSNEAAPFRVTVLLVAFAESRARVALAKGAMDSPPAKVYDGSEAKAQKR